MAASAGNNNELGGRFPRTGQTRRDFHRIFWFHAAKFAHFRYSFESTFLIWFSFPMAPKLLLLPPELDMGLRVQQPKTKSTLPMDQNQQYAWKEQTYLVPSSSRKKMQWKASALQGMQRLLNPESKESGTVTVPALYHRF